MEFTSPMRPSGNFIQGSRGGLSFLLYVPPYFFTLPFSSLLFRQVVLVLIYDVKIFV